MTFGTLTPGSPSHNTCRMKGRCGGRGALGEKKDQEDKIKREGGAGCRVGRKKEGGRSRTTNMKAPTVTHSTNDYH